MSKNALLRHAVVAVLFGAGSVTFAAQSPSSITTPSLSERTYVGFTQPSEQRKMNFNGPGVVSKVYVKEGDAVKAGQLLADQDTRAEKAEYDALAAKVISAEIEIKAADATLREKKVELEKKNNMLKAKGGAVIGQLEVLEAQLDVEVADARLDMSNKEKREKELDAEAAKTKIALKELRATTDGIVQQIGIHEGELASNDPKNSVISIVTNEPLYVEVDLPVAVTQSMKLHQKVDVRYEWDGPNAWKTAEVIFFNPVANAAGSSQHVRLQLANPEHIRSGMNVRVRLSENVASAR